MASRRSLRIQRRHQVDPDEDSDVEIILAHSQANNSKKKKSQRSTNVFHGLTPHTSTEEEGHAVIGQGQAEDSQGHNDQQSHVEERLNTFATRIDKLADTIDIINSTFQTILAQNNMQAIGKDISDNAGLVKRHCVPAIVINSESSYDQNSDDEDPDDSDNITAATVGVTYKAASGTTQIPPFTDKETWKIWFNRFETIADRNNWNKGQRLDQLLPRLHGKAGEFVFGQLPRKTRNNYNALIKELNNRYRVIETSKTFAAQFSKRQQKPGETVEEYAAELKRLYDKGHKERDSKTRDEDILRKFFNGLQNQKASFEVEYHKDPKDVDEAVYFIVSYVETKRTQKIDSETTLRTTTPTLKNDSSSDDDVTNENHIRYVDSSKNTQKKVNNSTNKATCITPEDMFRIMEKYLEEIKNIIGKSAFSANKTSQFNDKRCYTCGNTGHFARRCPLNQQRQRDTNHSYQYYQGQNVGQQQGQGYNGNAGQHTGQQ